MSIDKSLESGDRPVHGAAHKPEMMQRRKRLRNITLFAVVCLLNIGLIGLLWIQLITPRATHSPDDPTLAGEVSSPLVGKAASDFTLPILGGKRAQLHLADLNMKRFSFWPARPSYVTSLLIGSIFALGWTPCISLLLSSILVLAANTTTLQEGVLLLNAYSLGMGLPFLLLGLGVNQAQSVLKLLKPHVRTIEIGSGVLVILVGIAIFFNLLALLNSYVLLFWHI